MTTPRTVFRSLRVKARAGILIEGAGVLAAAFALFMVVSFAIDRSLRLEVGYRLVLLLLLLFALARLLYGRLLRPLGVVLDDCEMALAVERADPELHQALISAVQFEDVLRGGGPVVESREMMDAVVRDVDQRARRLDVRNALDRGRVGRYLALLVLGLALPVAWVAADSGTAKLWALRNLGLSSLEWPRASLLSFAGIDGDVVRVPEGDDVTVVVDARGVVPDQAFLLYRFASGERGRELMTLTGDSQFTFTLQSLLEDVTVRAEGGDGLTGDLHVVVVPRPRVEDLQVRLHYPDYMRKGDEVVGDGDIRAPRGAVLHVQARSTKPLLSASLAFGQERRVELAVADDRRGVSGSFTPTETGVLTLNVIDDDRLDSAQPPKLFLRLAEDQAPAVSFQPRGIGAMIAPQAVIPGTLQARDDYGLRALEARWQVSGVPENAAGSEGGPAAGQEPPWEPAEVSGLGDLVPDSSEFESPVAFDLRPLDQDSDPFAEANRVKPGQVVSLKFSARDNFGPGEPHTGDSEIVSFRVVTREKLIKDLERRQIEQRREIEQIIAEERTDVGELREILSPASEDPRAGKARLRVLTLARKQRALGKRTRNVADHYTQILEELGNNRILEPGKVQELQGQIVDPLKAVAAEEFPRSAGAVKDFAGSGLDDVRGVAVFSYETIIKKLEAVLEHMKQLETFATLLEDLRRVIKLQSSAINEAERKRASEAGSLFDPERGSEPGKGKSSKPDKNGGK